MLIDAFKINLEVVKKHSLNWADISEKLFTLTFKIKFKPHVSQEHTLRLHRCQMLFSDSSLCH